MWMKSPKLEELQRTLDSLGPPQTPYLLLDLSNIEEQYHKLRNAMPGVDIHYAVKANNHPEVLKTLIDVGSGFEVASFNEAAQLIELGLSASALYFSSPVKLPEDIRKAHEGGIQYFTFDSRSEIGKLDRYAPQCKVFLRLKVPSQGSAFPLNSKFGVPPGEASTLLREAKTAGLEPWGISFHVGSQCVRRETWHAA